MSTWRGTVSRLVVQRTCQEVTVEAATQEEAEAKLLEAAAKLTDAGWSRGWARELTVEEVYPYDD